MRGTPGARGSLAEPRLPPPERPDHPVDDLVDAIDRGGEVEADEVAAGRVEALARAEADARLLQEELEGGAVELQRRAVEPGEVGRLGRVHSDLGQLRLQPRHQMVAGPVEVAGG